LPTIWFLFNYLCLLCELCLNVVWDTGVFYSSSMFFFLLGIVDNSVSPACEEKVAGANHVWWKLRGKLCSVVTSHLLKKLLCGRREIFSKHAYVTTHTHFIGILKKQILQQTVISITCTPDNNIIVWDGGSTV
jgi:hypothetical protein